MEEELVALLNDYECVPLSIVRGDEHDLDLGLNSMHQEGSNSDLNDVEQLSNLSDLLLPFEATNLLPTLPSSNVGIETNVFADSCQHTISPTCNITKPSSDSLHSEHNNQKGRPQQTAESKRSISVHAATKEKQKMLSSREQKLMSLERQRKQNRESMQRARKRKRENMEQMRKTIRDLTDQYQQLSLEATKRRDRMAADNDAYRKLEAAYYESADLSHHLHNEKFSLEQLLAARQMFFLRIKLAMTDRYTELALPPSLMTTMDPLCLNFEFVPVTEHQADARVWDSMAQMRLLEEMAQPWHTLFIHSDSLSHELQYPMSPSATFGWEVLCKMSVEQRLFASFSKFFPNTIAQDLWEKTWVLITDPTMPSSPLRSVLRYAVLQVLNDDTIVTGIDSEHPITTGKVHRIIELRARLKTETGFAIATTMMNPMLSTPVDPMPWSHLSQVEYVDWNTRFDTIPEVDAATGVMGCRVKFYVDTEHKSMATMYTRLLSIFRGTLGWESVMIPSSLQLISFPS